MSTSGRHADTHAHPGAGELIRKTVHVVVSIVAVTMVWVLPPTEGRIVIAVAAVTALSAEAVRRGSRFAGALFDRMFGPLLRPHEGRGLTGATMLALGFALAALAFPPRFAGAGMLYAGVGDAASAVVGRHWGRIRYPDGKSLEGSLAFLVAAFLAGLVAPGIGLIPAAVAAVVTTILEGLPSRVDDNLALPLVGAAATWAAVAILG